jgi:hypothetical protein
MGHLLLLLLLVVSVLAVLLVRHFPMLGWLILSGFAIGAMDWTGLTPLVSFGGLAIYPADAASLVLVAAIVTTPGALRRVHASEFYVWVPVALLGLLAFERGVSAFGLAAAGNEARGFVQLAAATCWVWGRMRLPGFEKGLYRWSMITGLGLTVVAAIHIRSRGIGSVDQLILVDGQLVTSRPLVATQALVLGLVGIAFLVARRSGRDRLLGLVFVGVSVLCQHRTVWAALAVSLLAVILLSPRVRGRIAGWVVLGAVAVALAYATGLIEPLVSKFLVAFHSRGTLVDRQFAWRYLIDQQNAKGAFSVLFGQPFGIGFARREPGGNIETYAPHNWYVLLYLRIGLIGALLVALALVRGLVTNVVRRHATGVAWAAGLLTFCFAYNLLWYVAPLLAVALTARAAIGAETDEWPEQQPADGSARVPATTG